MFLKAVALSVAFIFTLNTVAWSAPASAAIRFDESRLETTPAEVKPLNFLDQILIPKPLGRIEEKFIPPQNLNRIASPAIIHIQNPHSSYEGQLKIRELLKHLQAQYGFNLILLEGGWGQLDPNRLKLFPDGSTNEKIALRLSEKGELGGGELFLLNSKPSAGHGVEDSALYLENLLNFRQVISKKTVSERFLEQIKNAIGTLGSHYFNPALKTFLKEWLFYQDESTKLLAHLETLKKTAKDQLSLDLDQVIHQRDWPNLIRLFKVKAIEGDIDFEKAHLEKDKLIASLPREGYPDPMEKNPSMGLRGHIVPEAISEIATPAKSGGLAMTAVQLQEFTDGLSAFFETKQPRIREPRKLLERFYEAAKPLGFEFKNYPALSLWLASYTLQSEIDSKELFSEIEKLTCLILEKLAQTSEEKALVSMLQNYFILKKLFSLELTRDEFDSLDQNRLLPTEFTKEIYALQNEKIKINLPVSNELDLIFKKASAFYSGTKKRDDAIMQNVLNIMREQKETKAVLVTGGFHSKGLTDQFKKNKIAYAEITPKISELGTNEQYLDVMMGQSTIAYLLGLQTEPPHSSTPEHLRRLFHEVQTRREKIIHSIISDLGLSARSEARGRINVEKIKGDYRKFRKSLSATDSWTGEALDLAGSSIDKQNFAQALEHLDHAIHLLKTHPSSQIFGHIINHIRIYRNDFLKMTMSAMPVETVTREFKKTNAAEQSILKTNLRQELMRRFVEAKKNEIRARLLAALVDEVDSRYRRVQDKRVPSQNLYNFFRSPTFSNFVNWIGKDFRLDNRSHSIPELIKKTLPAFETEPGGFETIQRLHDVLSNVIAIISKDPFWQWAEGNLRSTLEAVKESLSHRSEARGRKKPKEDSRQKRLFQELQTGYPGVEAWEYRAVLPARKELLPQTVKVYSDLSDEEKDPKRNPKVFELLRESWRHFGHRISDHRFKKLMDERFTGRRGASRQTGYYLDSLILYVGEEPVAVLDLKILRNRHFAIDDGLFVLSPYRGKHYGRALVDQAIVYLQENGIREFQLGRHDHAISSEPDVQKLVRNLAEDFKVQDALTHLWQDLNLPQEPKILSMVLRLDRYDAEKARKLKKEVTPLPHEEFWGHPRYVVKPEEMERGLFEKNEAVQSAIQKLALDVIPEDGRLVITNLKKPIDFRSYEVALAAHATLQDSVVILPTGLGKTDIAILRIHEAFLREPNAVILFTAPSNVLREQNATRLKEYLPAEWVAEITSDDSLENRLKSFEARGPRIIVATDALLASGKNPLPVEKTDFLIVDESHLVSGNHPSYQVIKQFRQKQREAGSFLALTATPDLPEKISAWLGRLGVPSEGVLAASDWDPWIRPYVFERFTRRHLIPWDERLNVAKAVVRHLHALAHRLDREKNFWEHRLDSEEISEMGRRMETAIREHSKKKWDEFYAGSAESEGFLKRWTHWSADPAFARLTQDHLRSLTMILAALKLLHISFHRGEAIEDQHISEDPKSIYMEKGVYRFTDGGLERLIQSLDEEGPMVEPKLREALTLYAGQLLSEQISIKLKKLMKESFRRIRPYLKKETQRRLGFAEYLDEEEKFIRVGEIESLAKKTQAQLAAARKAHDEEGEKIFGWLIKEIRHYQLLSYFERTLVRYGPVRLAKAIEKTAQTKKDLKTWKDKTQPALKNRNILHFVNWLDTRKIRHPKARHLLKQLEKTLRSPAHQSIDFVNDREAAKELAELVKEELWKETKVLMGQAQGGMTKNEQKEVVQEFREGKFPSLFSTQVGAMGMDFPNVRRVGIYDPTTDHRLFVQERGRTGRHGFGIVDILMLADSVEMLEYWKALHNEHRAQAWIEANQMLWSYTRSVPLANRAEVRMTRQEAEALVTIGQPFGSKNLKYELAHAKRDGKLGEVLEAIRILTKRPNDLIASVKIGGREVNFYNTDQTVFSGQPVSVYFSAFGVEAKTILYSRDSVTKAIESMLRQYENGGRPFTIVKVVPGNSYDVNEFKRRHDNPLAVLAAHAAGEIDWRNFFNEEVRLLAFRNEEKEHVLHVYPVGSTLARSEARGSEDKNAEAIRDRIKRLFKLKEAAKARAAAAYQMNRELAVHFNEWRNAKKSTRPERAELILRKIRDHADRLEDYARRMTTETDAASEIENEVNHLTPAQLRKRSLELRKRLDALTPLFTKAHKAQGSAELFQLNQEAVHLHKMRIKVQLLQTIHHLRAERINETAVLALLTALGLSYLKLSQEYAWEWRRAVISANLQKIQVVGGEGMEETYDYGTFKIYESDTKITLRKNQWKKITLEDGSVSYQLEPIDIELKDLNTAWRQQVDTLISQEKDYRNILFQLAALDYIRDLISAAPHGVSRFQMELIENTFAEIRLGAGGLERGIVPEKRMALANLDAILSAIHAEHSKEALQLISGTIELLKKRLQNIESIRRNIFNQKDYIGHQIRLEETRKALEDLIPFFNNRRFDKAHDLLNVLVNAYYQPIAPRHSQYKSLQVNLFALIRLSNLLRKKASPLEKKFYLSEAKERLERIRDLSARSEARKPLAKKEEWLKLKPGYFLKELKKTKTQALRELADDFNWDLRKFAERHSEVLPSFDYTGYYLLARGLNAEKEYRDHLIETFIKNHGLARRAVRALHIPESTLIHSISADFNIDFARIPIPPGTILNQLASQNKKTREEMKKALLKEMVKTSWNLPNLRKKSSKRFPFLRSPSFSYARFLWGLDLWKEFQSEDEMRSKQFGGVLTHIGKSFGWERWSAKNNLESTRRELAVLSGSPKSENIASVFDALGVKGPEDVIAELNLPEVDWSLPLLVSRHPEPLSWLVTRGWVFLVETLSIGNVYREILRERFIAQNGILTPAARALGFGPNPVVIRQLAEGLDLNLKAIKMPSGNLLKTLRPELAPDITQQQVLKQIQKKGWGHLAASIKELVRDLPFISEQNISSGEVIRGMNIEREFLEEFNERYSQWPGDLNRIGRSFGWPKGSARRTIKTMFRDLKLYVDPSGQVKTKLKVRRPDSAGVVSPVPSRKKEMPKRTGGSISPPTSMDLILKVAAPIFLKTRPQEKRKTKKSLNKIDSGALKMPPAEGPEESEEEPANIQMQKGAAFSRSLLIENLLFGLQAQGAQNPAKKAGSVEKLIAAVEARDGARASHAILDGWNDIPFREFNALWESIHDEKLRLEFTETFGRYREALLELVKKQKSRVGRSEARSKKKKEIQRVPWRDIEHLYADLDYLSGVNSKDGEIVNEEARQRIQIVKKIIRFHPIADELIRREGLDPNSFYLQVGDWFEKHHALIAQEIEKSNEIEILEIFLNWIQNYFPYLLPGKDNYVRRQQIASSYETKISARLFELRQTPIDKIVSELGADWWKNLPLLRQKLIRHVKGRDKSYYAVLKAAGLLGEFEDKFIERYQASFGLLGKTFEDFGFSNTWPAADLIQDFGINPAEIPILSEEFVAGLQKTKLQVLLEINAAGWNLAEIQKKWFGKQKFAHHRLIKALGLESEFKQKFIETFIAYGGVGDSVQKTFGIKQESYYLLVKKFGIHLPEEIPAGHLLKPLGITKQEALQIAKHSGWKLKTIAEELLKLDPNIPNISSYFTYRQMIRGLDLENELKEEAIHRQKTFAGYQKGLADSFGISSPEYLDKLLEDFEISDVALEPGSILSGLGLTKNQLLNRVRSKKEGFGFNWNLRALRRFIIEKAGLSKVISYPSLLKGLDLTREFIDEFEKTYVIYYWNQDKVAERFGFKGYVYMRGLVQKLEIATKAIKPDKNLLPHLGLKNQVELLRELNLYRWNIPAFYNTHRDNIPALSYHEFVKQLKVARLYRKKVVDTFVQKKGGKTATLKALGFKSHETFNELLRELKIDLNLELPKILKMNKKQILEALESLRWNLRKFRKKYGITGAIPYYRLVEDLGVQREFQKKYFELKEKHMTSLARIATGFGITRDDLKDILKTVIPEEKAIRTPQDALDFLVRFDWNIPALARAIQSWGMTAKTKQRNIVTTLTSFQLRQPFLQEFERRFKATFGSLTYTGAAFGYTVATANVFYELLRHYRIVPSEVKLEPGDLLKTLGLTESQLLRKLRSKGPDGFDWNIPKLYEFVIQKAPMSKKYGIKKLLYALGITEEFRREILRTYMVYYWNYDKVVQRFGFKKHKNIVHALASMNLKLSQLRASKDSLKSLGMNRRQLLKELDEIGWNWSAFHLRHKDRLPPRRLGDIELINHLRLRARFRQKMIEIYKKYVGYVLPSTRTLGISRETWYRIAQSLEINFDKIEIPEDALLYSLFPEKTTIPEKKQALLQMLEKNGWNLPLTRQQLGRQFPLVSDRNFSYANLIRYSGIAEEFKARHAKVFAATHGTKRRIYLTPVAAAFGWPDKQGAKEMTRIRKALGIKVSLIRNRSEARDINTILGDIRALVPSLVKEYSESVKGNDLDRFLRSAAVSKLMQFAQELTDSGSKELLDWTNNIPMLLRQWSAALDFHNVHAERVVTEHILDTLKMIEPNLKIPAPIELPTEPEPPRPIEPPTEPEPASEAEKEAETEGRRWYWETELGKMKISSRDKQLIEEVIPKIRANQNIDIRLEPRMVGDRGIVYLFSAHLIGKETRIRPQFNASNKFEGDTVVPIVRSVKTEGEKHLYVIDLEVTSHITGRPFVVRRYELVRNGELAAEPQKLWPVTEFEAVSETMSGLFFNNLTPALRTITADDVDRLRLKTTGEKTERRGIFTPAGKKVSLWTNVHIDLRKELTGNDFENVALRIDPAPWAAPDAWTASIWTRETAEFPPIPVMSVVIFQNGDFLRKSTVEPAHVGYQHVKGEIPAVYRTFKGALKAEWYLYWLANGDQVVRRPADDEVAVSITGRDPYIFRMGGKVVQASLWKGFESGRTTRSWVNFRGPDLGNARGVRYHNSESGAERFYILFKNNQFQEPHELIPLRKTAGWTKDESIFGVELPKAKSAGREQIKRVVTTEIVQIAWPAEIGMLDNELFLFSNRLSNAKERQHTTEALMELKQKYAILKDDAKAAPLADVDLASQWTEFRKALRKGPLTRRPPPALLHFPLNHIWKGDKTHTIKLGSSRNFLRSAVAQIQSNHPEFEYFWVEMGDLNSLPALYVVGVDFEHRSISPIHRYVFSGSSVVESQSSEHLKFDSILFDFLLENTQAAYAPALDDTLLQRLSQSRIRLIDKILETDQSPWDDPGEAMNLFLSVPFQNHFLEARQAAGFKDSISPLEIPFFFALKKFEPAVQAARQILNGSGDHAAFIKLITQSTTIRQLLGAQTFRLLPLEMMLYAIESGKITDEMQNQIKRLAQAVIDAAAWAGAPEPEDIIEEIEVADQAELPETAPPEITETAVEPKQVVQEQIQLEETQEPAPTTELAPDDPRAAEWQSELNAISSEPLRIFRRAQAYYSILNSHMEKEEWEEGAKWLDHILDLMSNLADAAENRFTPTEQAEFYDVEAKLLSLVGADPATIAESLRKVLPALAQAGLAETEFARRVREELQDLENQIKTARHEEQIKEFDRRADEIRSEIETLRRDIIETGVVVKTHDYNARQSTIVNSIINLRSFIAEDIPPLSGEVVSKTQKILNDELFAQTWQPFLQMEQQRALEKKQARSEARGGDPAETKALVREFRAAFDKVRKAGDLVALSEAEKNLFEVIKKLKLRRLAAERRTTAVKAGEFMAKLPMNALIFEPVSLADEIPSFWEFKGIKDGNVALESVVQEELIRHNFGISVFTAQEFQKRISGEKSHFVYIEFAKGVAASRSELREAARDILDFLKDKFQNGVLQILFLFYLAGGKVPDWQPARIFALRAALWLFFRFAQFEISVQSKGIDPKTAKETIREIRRKALEVKNGQKGVETFDGFLNLIYRDSWVPIWREVWRNKAIAEKDTEKKARFLYFAIDQNPIRISKPKKGYEDPASTEALYRKLTNIFPRAIKKSFENEGLSIPEVHVISIKNPRGGKDMRGYLIGKGPLAVVLHGMTTTKEQQMQIPFVKKLVSEGNAVLLVDLPSHGENPDIPLAPEGIDDFWNAILNHFDGTQKSKSGAELKVDGSQIGLYGFSFGGNIALRAVLHKEFRKRIKAVIAVNAPVHASFEDKRKVKTWLDHGRIYYEKMFGTPSSTEHEKRLRALQISKEEFESIPDEYLNRMLFFYGGSKDRLISTKEAPWLRERYRTAKVDPEQFITVYPGEGHYYYKKKDEAFSRMTEFMTRLFRAKEAIQAIRTADANGKEVHPLVSGRVNEILTRIRHAQFEVARRKIREAIYELHKERARLYEVRHTQSFTYARMLANQDPTAAEEIQERIHSSIHEEENLIESTIRRLNTADDILFPYEAAEEPKTYMDLAWPLRFFASILFPLLKLFFVRTNLAGIERVPVEGPGVFVSNHFTLQDGLFLTAMIAIITDMLRSQGKRLRMRLLAFFARVTDLGWLQRRLIENGAAIEIKEGLTVRIGRKHLEKDALIANFPAGEASKRIKDSLKNWDIKPFRLAVEAGVPVIPIAIWGIHPRQTPRSLRDLTELLRVSLPESEYKWFMRKPPAFHPKEIRSYLLFPRWLKHKMQRIPFKYWKLFLLFAKLPPFYVSGEILDPIDTKGKTAEQVMLEAQNAIGRALDGKIINGEIFHHVPFEKASIKERPVHEPPAQEPIEIFYNTVNEAGSAVEALHKVFERPAALVRAGEEIGINRAAAGKNLSRISAKPGDTGNWVLPLFQKGDIDVYIHISPDPQTSPAVFRIKTDYGRRFLEEVTDEEEKNKILGELKKENIFTLDEGATGETQIENLLSKHDLKPVFNLHATVRYQKAAETIRKGYDPYITYLDEIADRAGEIFEQRDWQRRSQDDQEKISLYGIALDPVEEKLKLLLGNEIGDENTWEKLKKFYPLPGHYDDDLAITFFYSSMRRRLGPLGIPVEYDDDGVNQQWTGPQEKIYKRYLRVRYIEPLMQSILRDAGFKVRYENLGRDAKQLAEQLERKLKEETEKMKKGTGSSNFEWIDVVKYPFFRNKGAYLVGGIRQGGITIPIAILILNREDRNGLVVARLDVGEDKVSNIFSYARSSFHVTTRNIYRELAAFLSDLLPRRSRADIYSAIGFEHPAKIELRKNLYEFLELHDEQFQVSEGLRGKVLEVIDLPSFPYAFKIIRDKSKKYPDHKNLHAFVKSQHNRVHEMDRVGRMLGFMTFYNLVLPKKAFPADLLEDLLKTASQSVELRGDVVVLKHVYIQRKVTPLNIYLNDPAISEEQKKAAVIDLGNAIKDLAAAGVFDIDYSIFNFGVTRYGRVVLYDFDSNDNLTDWTFSHRPEHWDELASDETDEHDVPGPKEIHTEWMMPFLAIPEAYHDAFLSKHADLLQPEYWNAIKKQLQENQVPDIFPYDEGKGLRSSRSEARQVPRSLHGLTASAVNRSEARRRDEDFRRYNEWLRERLFKLKEDVTRELLKGAPISPEVEETWRTELKKLKSDYEILAEHADPNNEGHMGILEKTSQRLLDLTRKLNGIVKARVPFRLEPSRTEPDDSARSEARARLAPITPAGIAVSGTLLYGILPFPFAVSLPLPDYYQLLSQMGVRTRQANGMISDHLKRKLGIPLEPERRTSFGISIIPTSGSFSGPLIDTIVSILSEYPNKFVLVAAEGIDEFEIKRLNDTVSTVEAVKGRLAVIGTNGKPYSETLLDFLRQNRRSHPAFPNIYASLGRLAGEAGIKKLNIFDRTSAVGSAKAIDRENQLSLTNVRLLTGSVPAKVAAIDELRALAVLSIVTAGELSQNPELLKAELIRSNLNIRNNRNGGIVAFLKENAAILDELLTIAQLSEKLVAQAA